MEIKLEATLWIPGTLAYYGGKNYHIFSKKMDVKLKYDQILSFFRYQYYMTEDNVYLQITHTDKVGEQMVAKGSGSLVSVSKEYFEILKDNGWILNVQGAEHHGVPDDSKDKSLV